MQVLGEVEKGGSGLVENREESSECVEGSHLKVEKVGGWNHQLAKAKDQLQLGGGSGSPGFVNVEMLRPKEVENVDEAA